MSTTTENHPPLTPENHPLFPNTFYTAPLETWADAIKRLSSEAERCFLEKVEHYKALSVLEHEFLVVYASDPSGSKIVLGVDRNAQGSEKSLSTLVYAKSSPSPSSSSSEKGSPHLAYDRVRVSHDGTPAPILYWNSPYVLLYSITFSPTSSLTASTSTSTSTSSNPDTRRVPSLLHLSVLLVTIRRRFPSYTLLQYQCYFFARATCLALMDLFGGVPVMDLEENKQVATWRGVHVSQYLAGCTVLLEMLPLAVIPALLQKVLLLSASAALQKLLLLVASPVLRKMLLLSLVSSPWLLVPAGLYSVYSMVENYYWKVVESEVDMQRIR
jgi:hypothetical protein